MLIGDPHQLASVEAGAVLGDVVGAPALERATVVLRTGHRFAGGIAALAEAVRVGDTDAALAVLRAGRDDVRWIDADVAGAEASAELGADPRPRRRRRSRRDGGRRGGRRRRGARGARLVPAALRAPPGPVRRRDLERAPSPAGSAPTSAPRAAASGTRAGRCS